MPQIGAQHTNTRRYMSPQPHGHEAPRWLMKLAWSALTDQPWRTPAQSVGLRQSGFCYISSSFKGLKILIFEAIALGRWGWNCLEEILFHLFLREEGDIMRRFLLMKDLHEGNGIFVLLKNIFKKNKNMFRWVHFWIILILSFILEVHIFLYSLVFRNEGNDIWGFLVLLDS